MQIPPPIIHSSRLLEFAFNDQDVEFTDRINLFVGDGELKRLGEMQGVAICSSYAYPDEYLLFFCDDNWEVHGTIPFVSIDEAKLRAERGYKGINNKWEESQYSEEEINDFLREEYEVDPTSKWWEEICSFCGEDIISSGQGFAGQKATICGKCVEEFYAHLHEESNT